MFKLQLLDTMGTCPATGLPVSSKPHWVTLHPSQHYTTKFCLIGQDIVGIHVETENNGTVILDHVDFDTLSTVLEEENLTDKPLYTVVDMGRIQGCSYCYKKDLVNLLYNRGPLFKLLVLYNLHPDMQLNAETFMAITPEESAVRLARTYAEAMEMILADKEGRPLQTGPNSQEEQKYESLKKDFFAALARIVWLDLLNHRILLPEEGEPYLYMFRALDGLKEDMREKRDIMNHERSILARNHEQKIAEKTTQLQALQALNHSMQVQLDRKKSELSAMLSSKDITLQRISDSLAEKLTKTEKLGQLVGQLDIDKKLKEKIVGMVAQITRGSPEPAFPGQDLSTADRKFLSKLASRHPELSEKERRVCLMILENLTNPDISLFIGITPRGVETLRYRMHKKLGLEKHETIKTYLQDLAAEIR
ncbi:hypothetical protein CHL67_09880 [Prosthecochloris sp. GSB1]|uniref:helix-turn-helix transcriptional regulator n=1 Tax=Prosthecochloris sp. GSB1 TaxID=281093 RepID=UPI000B8CDB1B|nr:hypothetical protein [Prosthecochloris sp. GSB1]ASQ91181.1 hypothetical protein CHL67_09880 [Prosthecochloris sp. GSB1]